MIGVYKITNLINNRFYIGQSSDIKARWYNHKARLKDNKHRNKELQKEWNLYGSSNFKFEILVECETKDLERLESYYMLKLKAIENGYNIHRPLDYSSITEKEVMKYKERLLIYIKKKGKTLLEYSTMVKDLNITYNDLRIVLKNIGPGDEQEYNLKINKGDCYGVYKNGYITIENKANIQRRAKEAISKFAII